MPYPSEHAARMREPADFEPDSIRSKDIAPGVRLLSGHLKGEDGAAMVAQAYRFDVAKFSEEQARVWLREHKLEPLTFEPATSGAGEEETVAESGSASRGATLRPAAQVHEAIDLGGKSVGDLVNELTSAVSKAAATGMFGPAGEHGPDCWVQEVFDTSLVIRRWDSPGCDESCYRVNWARNEAGGVMLSDVRKVERQQTWVDAGPGPRPSILVTISATPMTESCSGRLLRLHEADPAAGAGAQPKGSEWDVVVLGEGLSLNNRYYGAALLKRTAKFFDGVSVFAYELAESLHDHLPAVLKDRLGQGGGLLRNRIGQLTEARYEAGTGIVAKLKVAAKWAREALLDLWEAGQTTAAGFSIDAQGAIRERADGTEEVVDLSPSPTLDLVTHPAAGGRVLRLVASLGAAPGRTAMSECRACLSACQACIQLCQACIAACEARMATETDQAARAACQSCAECCRACIAACQACCVACQACVDANRAADPACVAACAACVVVAQACAACCSSTKAICTDEACKTACQACADACAACVTACGACRVSAPAPVVAPRSATADQAAQLAEAVERRIECRLLVERTIAASGLPEVARGKLIESLRPRCATFTSVDAAKATADAAIAAERAYIASLAPPAVSGLGSLPTREAVLQPGQDRLDRLQLAMDGLFARGDVKGPDGRPVPRFRNLHEAVLAITGRPLGSGGVSATRLLGAAWGYRPHFAGDHDWDRRTESVRPVGAGYRKVDLATMPGRGEDVRESISFSTFGQILGDSITRKLVADFAQSPLQNWRLVVSDVVPLSDYRTQRRQVFGWYGELTTVSEGNNYPDLSTPGDDEETYTPAKRGGIETITEETILGDDVGLIVRIPQRMAYAAILTLHRAVFGIFTANPNMYDGNALFVAGHGNLGSAALSGASARASRLAMMDQIPYGGSAEHTMGAANSPRLLCIPNELVDTADALTGEVAIAEPDATGAMPADANGTVKNPAWYRSIVPLQVPYWTSATQHVYVADPKTSPTIEVGFVNGQEEPEISVADDLGAGGVRFTADKIQYRVKYAFGAKALDWRGFYRQTP